jgi:hypothetical protein
MEVNALKVELAPLVTPPELLVPPTPPAPMTIE